MPISAAGNDVTRTLDDSGKGFTLLELMVVVAIVAIATLGVVLSLRDAAQTQLDTEAQRLAALLESGRAQSRMLGVPVRWRPTAKGFEFLGLQKIQPRSPATALPDQWQFAGTSASVAAPLLLGPEPLLPPQQVRLWKTEQPGRVLVVGTDGVRPFAVLSPDANAAVEAKP
jgi:general secretion pathway protein H